MRVQIAAGLFVGQDMLANGFMADSDPAFFG
jgi:hypothetical protein